MHSNENNKRETHLDSKGDVNSSAHSIFHSGRLSSTTVKQNGLFPKKKR
jgi:hypothetical protein